MNFSIRILHPTGVTSSYETVPYPTADAAWEQAQQLGEVLAGRGIREYEIHVIDASTGTVAHTLVRRTDPTRVDPRQEDAHVW